MIALDFKLHKKQSIAFKSPAREIFYGGALGGGKSYLIRIAAIVWAAEIAGLNVYLFRRTYGELHKSHMQGPKGFYALLDPWVRAGFCEIVKEEIRFWNGSRIFLCHLQHEDDVHKYLSTEMHVLMIDEASMFTETMYRMLRSRVRMTGLNLPDQYKDRFPRIILTSNPGNIGHNWLKQGFVDGARDTEIRQMSPLDGGFTRQFIRAKLEDNPTLLNEDPNYLDSLEGLGSPELVKAMRHGDWNVIAGSFFPEFSDQHVIEPFTIPDFWTRIMAGDTGYADPFAFTWYAVASDDYWIGPDVVIPRNALICYREFYGLAKDDRGKWKWNEGVRRTVEDYAQDIVEMEKDERIDDRVLDPSAFAHKTGPSEAEMFQRRGLIFRRADNTRVPRSGHRGGWMEMRQRLRGIDGRPMLYFFDTCFHTLRTIPLQQHDTHNAEDMAQGEDHLIDTVRYACMARPWSSSPPPPTEPVFRNPTMGELTRQFDRRNTDKRI